jgi:hypothetical protein
MLNNQQTFNPKPITDQSSPPLKVGAETALDWDNFISIDMIRAHTKTDDVPAVTDDQLRLYRKTAVEAAEKYTGLLLSKQITVTEPLAGPRRPKLGQMTYKHTLQWPVADGMVYVYGGRTPDENRNFMVPKNTRTISVPIRNGYFDLSNCCDPCSKWSMNGDLMAFYKAGFNCAEEVPAGVLLGILQFIAWVVEHPGDELLSQRNKMTQRETGAFGSNNIALASGALETWRQYDPEAI